MFRTAILAIVLIVTTPFSTIADAPPAVDHTPEVVFADDEGPVVVINTPDKVKVGDMIVVDVSESKGKGFDLKIIPEPPRVRVFNNGSVICCGTGSKNVEYLFIVSCSDGERSDVKTKVIKVTGGSDGTVNPSTSLEERVVTWCEGVESPTTRDDALKLAQSFYALAGVIETGAFSSVKEMMQATIASNQDALGDNLDYWTPFLDRMEQELMARARAGQLPSVEAHGPVWRKIADGLTLFAGEVPDDPEIPSIGQKK